MSIVTDILDDKREFYLETEDKIKLYAWNTICVLPFILFIPSIMFLVNVQGIENYFAALHLAFWTNASCLVIMCSLRLLITIWAEKYKKLTIDKDNNFIFTNKNGKTEVIKLNEIKSVTITRKLTIEQSEMGGYNPLRFRQKLPVIRL